jgi:ABC-type multidrug transport system fused ATPase/permease subunit
MEVLRMHSLVIRHKGLVAVSWLIGAIAAVLALVTPNEIGRLTSLFASGGQVTWSPVYRGLALMIGAQLLLSAVSYARKRIEVNLHESMLRSITIAVFGRVLRFRPDFFRDHPAEDINVRTLDDTGRVARFFLDAVVVLPIALVNLVAFGGYMIAQNWFMGLCLIPLSLLSGYFILFDRQVQIANRRELEAWVAVRRQASELIEGVAEIRGHAAFEYAVDRLASPLEEHKAAMLQFGKLTALFHALNPLVAAVQNGALYWIGAALCIGSSTFAAFAGPLVWGDVIKFLLVAMLFQKPASAVVEFCHSWRLARESMRRVDEYLQQPLAFGSQPEAPRLSSSGVSIEIRDVSVPSGQGAKIADSVNLAVAAGGHVALAGPAGGGKSTLVQLLTRNVRPAMGEVKLDGRNIEDYDFRSLARELGYVPQKPVLFDLSIRDNILLGLRRPSQCSLGGLDVSGLPQVRTLSDLNERLLHVVRLAGLEADVLRKCFDLAVPQGSFFDALSDRIVALRRDVRGRTVKFGSDAVVAFEHGNFGPIESAYQNARCLRENLLWGEVNSRSAGSAKRIDGALGEAVTAFGLLDEAVLTGLEFRVGEGGKFLSGGQKQKVALARILMKDPSIVLLDEATASLDEISQAHVMELVRSHFAGKTVLCVSHRLPVIRQFDRIVVLDHGQVAQDGTYEDLKMSDGLFRELAAHGGQLASEPERRSGMAAA